ncbi:serine protease SP24D-like [Anopheles bellator]|uniref:serine protease SP24D-like n=1 Tax=Anopheles bellator TaxID=139047 RepID=UPI002649D7E4|nr:serine protease SP24D-like [Anopheles bellator]
MKHFLAVCWAALMVSLGDASPLDTRVVDGETAGRAQFPYQVTLTLKRHPLCGGVLVHERFFLTAAHCFFKGDTPVPVDDLNVFYGSEKLFSKGKYNRVKTVHVHDQYDQQSFRYDLALVETRRSFEFSFTAQPVALATEPLAEPSSVTVSGFGRTAEAGNTAFKLKYAQLTTLPADQCQDATGEGFYEGALCLDTTNGGGFCAGDYGGPAVFNETLVGVGSYTVGGRCEAGTPDVFVEVAHFSDWVQATLDGDSETDSRHL